MRVVLTRKQCVCNKSSELLDIAWDALESKCESTTGFSSSN